MIQATPKLVGTTPASRADADRTKLKSAAQAFEAVFLRQMIGAMREASLGDGMLDNEGTEQFQTMADSKTADAMSDRGVLHIADMLMKQLAPQVAKAGGAATASTADAKVPGAAS